MPHMFTMSKSNACLVPSIIARLSAGPGLLPLIIDARVVLGVQCLCAGVNLGE